MATAPSDPNAWWQMISGGQQPSVSPFNDMMQSGGLPGISGGLANWLANPRQPGQSSAAQMPAPTPYTPPPIPQQPAQQSNPMSWDPYRQLQAQGYANIGGEMVTMDPRMWSGPMSKGYDPATLKPKMMDARNDDDWAMRSRMIY